MDDMRRRIWPGVGLLLLVAVAVGGVTYIFLASNRDSAAALISALATVATVVGTGAVWLWSHMRQAKAPNLGHAAAELAKEVRQQSKQAERELISPTPTGKPITHVVPSFQQSIFHTRYVVDFELEFRHTLVYERRDKFVLGVVLVFWLDGVEVFRGGVTSVIGRTAVDFTVEGELARLTITGLLVGVSVSVKDGGIEILKI